MSVVLTTLGVQRLVLNLSSYMDNFWGFLTDARILPAGPLPDWIADSEGTTEQQKMFFEWVRETKTKWPGFTRRFKYHFFATDQRSQLMADWLPPVAYAAAGVPSYALPQYPQQRVKISDPTDSRGRKRSIRVHFAEKGEKR